MVSFEFGIEVTPVTRITDVQGFTSLTLDEPRTLVNLMGAEELP